MLNSLTVMAAQLKNIADQAEQYIAQVRNNNPKSATAIKEVQEIARRSAELSKEALRARKACSLLHKTAGRFGLAKVSLVRKVEYRNG